MTSRILAVLLSLISLPSHGEAVTNLNAAIEKSFPSFGANSVAKGSLASDKVQYVATLLARSVEEDNETEMQVAVFKHKKDDSYELVSHSATWRDYQPHRRGWSGIRIEKKSILFSFGGSTSCCSGDTTEFKFRKLGSKLALAGEETKSYGYEDNSDPIQYFESRRSINFLSGKVIHTKRTGKSLDNEEFGFSGKTRYQEITLAFPNSKQWKLSDFQTDEYSNFVWNTPNLCGFINEKGRYKSCKS